MEFEILGVLFQFGISFKCRLCELHYARLHKGSVCGNCLWRLEDDNND